MSESAMDCERYDKIALNLLYEELDELTTAAARRHLHHCTRCKTISAGMQATREIATVPLVKAPDGLRDAILEAERQAHKQLSFRERVERTISVMAGYAMRPQLAMAATLLLCVAFSLVFLQARPAGHDQVSVTERGVPGLDAESLPRHSVVTEPLPPEPAASAPQAVDRSPAPVDKGVRAGAVADEASPRKKAEESSESSRAAHPRPEQEGGPSFDQALAAYHAGRYAEAEQQFRSVAAAGGQQASRAALHEAHAARNGSGCHRAAALYDTVATRYAATPTADEASWHAASCYRALGQTERARAHYRILATRPGYAERSSQALAALETEPGRESSAVAARKPAASSSEAAKASPSPSSSATNISSAPAAASPPAKDAPAEQEP